MIQGTSPSLCRHVRLPQPNAEDDENQRPPTGPGPWNVGETGAGRGGGSIARRFQGCEFQGGLRPQPNDEMEMRR